MEEVDEEEEGRRSEHDERAMSDGRKPTTDKKCVSLSLH